MQENKVTEFTLLILILNLETKLIIINYQYHLFYFLIVPV